MWQLFKEYIWESLLGKVLSVIGGASTIWSIVLLSSPSVYNNVPQTFRIDSRIWYGITIAILISVCIWILRKANNDREQAQRKDNIRLVYNEEKYSLCREISSNREVFRVGYRVLGNQPVDNPEVFPRSMFKVIRTKYASIPVSQVTLIPVNKTDKVNPTHNLTPSHWINVFRHKIDSPTIEFFYENYQSEPIKLTIGEYHLNLVARGFPCDDHTRTLIIRINKSNKLSVENKKHE